MSVTDPAALDDPAYAEALAGEGEYWDNYIAQRLLRGEMPGSIDWRLNFTQFRYNHKWLPFCLGPQGINFRMREIRDVLTTASRRPGLRVLDLGCGAGWLSLELARLGARVTAVDISPTNLAIGRYMAETNTRNFPYLYQGFAGLPCRLADFGSVEFVFGDLNTITLPQAEYDAVVVWDSLHHIRDLERLLEQVRTTLKPDGMFLGVDHAFASRRAEEFNLAVLPWLDEFYAWVTAEDPAWLYEGVNALARPLPWGVLAVDYDPTPVPGVEAFFQHLFDELLEIVRQGLRQEAIEHARAQPVPRAGAPAAEEEESPFEDVSADRLMQVLVEQFEVEDFRTIGPWIQPERHIPHYRNELERIFQHYLSALLIDAGERAITEGQADGQWFLFHLAPGRPSQLATAAIPSRAASTAGADRVARLEWELQRRAEYIAHLEAEIERKNAALARIERRLRQSKIRSLLARLPWRQLKRGGH